MVFLWFDMMTLELTTHIAPVGVKAGPGPHVDPSVDPRQVRLLERDLRQRNVESLEEEVQSLEVRLLSAIQNRMAG